MRDFCLTGLARGTRLANLKNQISINRKKCPQTLQALKHIGRIGQLQTRVSERVMTKLLSAGTTLYASGCCKSVNELESSGRRRKAAPLTCSEVVCRVQRGLWVVSGGVLTNGQNIPSESNRIDNGKDSHALEICVRTQSHARRTRDQKQENPNAKADTQRRCSGFGCTFS